MAEVTLSKRAAVAVITLDNPPVNALSAAVRAGLVDRIAAAIGDSSITALVITGSGRIFSGGADIREFGTPAMTESPTLRDVIEIIENAPKHVIAALHGTAAGGGLELALGCHHRLATSGTRVGLPEVTLGIVPGAGGTQRLPRLIGVRPALDMIVSGKLIPAAEAHELGVVDDVVEGDVLDAAAAFAESVAAEGASPRKTSEMEEKVDVARKTPEIFEEFRHAMARRARGLEAPYACVEAVEAAVNLRFDEGLEEERRIFVRCLGSEQSKTLRYVFFAEREVAKIPDVPRETPTLSINAAAVIGCGTMGGGIAMSFANAGIPVRVLEADRDTLDRGLGVVRKNYASSVSKGPLSQAEMEARMGLISSTLDYGDLADADIVIEAVFEEMDLKQKVFSKLDAVCKSDAILATNTSALDVNEIAAASSRPDRVMGTHFFSPANVMRLMENVRGDETSNETIATVMKLSRTIGKVGVLVGVCDGFVGNRMLHPYLREAEFLLEEGALPHQVDRALHEFGFAMGPFAVADLAGLDVGLRIRKRQAATRPKHLRYPRIADRICEMSRFGQKTGAGWYRYESGSRTPLPDPDIEELIESVSDELDIERREIGDEEIIQRCLYPLINEGAKILDEGIALRASDIDVIWILGFGFPRYRGGPMFYADTVGIETIYHVMNDFYDANGELMKPAPLLEELASQGRGFRA